MPRKYSDIMDDLTNSVRRYYDAINEGSFMSVHVMIDIDLFDGFGDTTCQLPLHNQLLGAFQRMTGKIEVVDVVMDVHLGENLPIYKGRDYAKGKTKWKDEKGVIHFFSEHWVRGERCWFTRNLTPKGL